jgi:hypothetical protein
VIKKIASDSQHGLNEIKKGKHRLFLYELGIGPLLRNVPGANGN